MSESAENPYRPPASTGAGSSSGVQRKIVQSALGWAVVGMLAGAALVAPLILSPDVMSRLEGGMIFGGIPGAFAGRWYGVRRAAKRSHR
jgi:hypothetical protein